MNLGQAEERIASRHIVLIGMGHTNSHVVRMWAMNPIPDTDLTCISDNSITTYSGLLPAVLAGQRVAGDMEIDLVQLCSHAGARLLIGEVTGLDHNQRLVCFRDRPPVPFDVLSIGIGSVPSITGVQIEGDSLLKIKPMQTFLDRLDVAVRRKRSTSVTMGDPLRIIVVGSGVAGLEITFCLPPFLATRCSGLFKIEVVTRSKRILEGVSPSMRRRVERELDRREIQVITGKSILKVAQDRVVLGDGVEISADLVIWATGASSPLLLEKLKLPKDAQGFLKTDATLRSTSGEAIFAVGDTGTIADANVPKAGVYAVRQGPVLWKNIHAILEGKSLASYRPQRSFLKILTTGDACALGEWKGVCFGGSWVRSLKDRIDSNFIKKFRVPKAAMGTVNKMQCKGCGCKLGSKALSGAVTAIGPNSSVALIPADQLDDAAVVSLANDQIVVSTDFFSSPFDDPYLTGRVIALHSASDLLAMGATVTAAVANVVLPEGEATSQGRTLNDLLQGARREFEAMGASIVGGHTIVGPRFEVGFTVIGEPPLKSMFRKQNLRLGDILYLTKPLGIGVLLAAHMRGQCAARDYEKLITTMLRRQDQFTKVALQHGVKACTDVTGFGLAGHLIEMLTASQLSAILELQSIPLLSGVTSALCAGVESTLAPENRHVEGSIFSAARHRSMPEYHALFDPQTSGGLLLAVTPAEAQSFEQSVKATADGEAFVIGKVTSADARALISIE